MRRNSPDASCSLSLLGLDLGIEPASWVSENLISADNKLGSETVSAWECVVSVNDVGCSHTVSMKWVKIWWIESISLLPASISALHIFVPGSSLGDRAMTRYHTGEHVSGTMHSDWS